MAATCCNTDSQCFPSVRNSQSKALSSSETNIRRQPGLCDMYGLPDLNTEDKTALVLSVLRVSRHRVKEVKLFHSQVQKQLRAYLLALLETGVTMIRVRLSAARDVGELPSHVIYVALLGVDAAMNIYPESLAQARVPTPRKSCVAVKPLSCTLFGGSFPLPGYPCSSVGIHCAGLHKPHPVPGRPITLKVEPKGMDGRRSTTRTCFKIKKIERRPGNVRSTCLYGALRELVPQATSIGAATDFTFGQRLAESLFDGFAGGWYNRQGISSSSDASWKRLQLHSTSSTGCIEGPSSWVSFSNCSSKANLMCKMSLVRSMGIWQQGFQTATTGSVIRGALDLGDVCKRKSSFFPARPVPTDRALLFLDNHDQQRERWKPEARTVRDYTCCAPLKPQ